MREKSYSNFDLQDDDSYASILLLNKILKHVPPKSGMLSCHSNGSSWFKTTKGWFWHLIFNKSHELHSGGDKPHLQALSWTIWAVLRQECKSRSWYENTNLNTWRISWKKANTPVWRNYGGWNVLPLRFCTAINQQHGYIFSAFMMMSLDR